MKRSQNGFSIVEVLLALVIVGLIAAVGWYVFERPSWQSRNQLTKVLNEIKLPASYKLTKTTFSTDHPELSTIYSVSRDYQLTEPTTRAEALQQMVKSLDLNPADHQTVSINDEQFNGVPSPLFPSGTKDWEYRFYAKLEPTVSINPADDQCLKNSATQALYVTCVDKDPSRGNDAPVKTVELSVDKEPNY